MQYRGKIDTLLGRLNHCLYVLRMALAPILQARRPVAPLVEPAAETAFVRRRSVPGLSVSIPLVARCPERANAPPAGRVVCLEESACEKFLNVLTELLAGGMARMSTLELPDQPIRGFGASDTATQIDNESQYLGAQFRDGLAILNTLPSRVAFRTWSPADGLSEPSLGP